MKGARNAAGGVEEGQIISPKSNRTSATNSPSAENAGNIGKKSIKKGTPVDVDAAVSANVSSNVNVSPRIEIDPAKLAEINRIVDEAENMKFINPGTKKMKKNIGQDASLLQQSNLAAIEAGVDETLMGTLEMIVGVTGALEPATKNTIDGISPKKEHDDEQTNEKHSADEEAAALTDAILRQDTTDISNNTTAACHNSNPNSPNRNTKMNLIDRSRLWVVDAGDLGQDVECHTAQDRLSRFLADITLYKDKIAGLRINGIKFTNAEAAMISSVIWENTGVLRKGKFPYLVDLDCSYLCVDNMLPSIRIVLDPVKSGYCPIKRLVMTQCGLGIDGIRTIIVSLKNNVFVEELILNGNNCTDSCMPDIVNTLKSSSSRLKFYINISSR